MSDQPYRFLKIGQEAFELYQGEQLLLRFNRSNFRQKFEDLASSLGRSSNWIGSMLRLFLKNFPPPFPEPSRTGVDRYSHFTLAEYLKSKGFRVFRPLDLSDAEIVSHLEAKGYYVEGMLNDSYYSTSFSKKEALS